MTLTKIEVKDLPIGFTKTAEGPNRKDRRYQPAKEHNNRKGSKRVIVMGRKKFYRTKQVIGNKVIFHLLDHKLK